MMKVLRTCLIVLTLIAFSGCAAPTINMNRPTNHADVERVNRYVNSFKYVSDQKQFGRTDVWQHPKQMLFKTQQGDCEDFAFAKAYLLINMLKMDQSRIEFVYLVSKIGKPAHLVMVLDDTYVLDNEFYHIKNVKSLENRYIIGTKFNYKQMEKAIEQREKQYAKHLLRVGPPYGPCKHNHFLRQCRKGN